MRPLVAPPRNLAKVLIETLRVRGVFAHAEGMYVAISEFEYHRVSVVGFAPVVIDSNNRRAHDRTPIGRGSASALRRSISSSAFWNPRSPVQPIIAHRLAAVIPCS